MKCQPSLLENGPLTRLRERLLTPWRNAAEMQAFTTHMRMSEMLPVYAEFSPDLGFREIYWRPQVPVAFEVRSGRTREEFLRYQEVNEARGWSLLTLHLSPGDFFSAVWLDQPGRGDALPVLEGLGIGLAAFES